jgi:NitT/TauT family transport system substrate-binding protein
LLSPTSFVLAPKDSPIKSLADLKGKKLGLFGGPQAAISAMLFIIGKRWHGVDLSRESQLITAPNPALAALLDKKDLDAALFGSTESLTLFLTGRYKIIADVGEEWERRGGRAPAHVVMATTEAFAKANPDLLRDFVRAYREAVRYIRDHPEVWEEWGRKEGITSKEGIQLLRERIGPRIVDVWDRKQMEAQRELLEIMIEVLGEKFLKAVPAGLMTDAYVP